MNEWQKSIIDKDIQSYTAYIENLELRLSRYHVDQEKKVNTELEATRKVLESLNKLKQVILIIKK